ncbi:Cell wall assembly regulator [Exophiala dermatitidis]|nr:Cell wall assembly regulator [Exophiala dermatitidis]KAJ4619193.1 Cell wall assembly regulator [Exophiala dermatitidis]KAJ4697300.1 Cell wall assembly regulator [Exophiala dermatitidis]
MANSFVTPPIRPESAALLTSSSLTTAWRSFWHAMTSNDRHASYDSPYKTGQHMPVGQSRHAPLTSVATSAADSHQDLPSTYQDDSKRPSVSSTQLAQSPIRPYSPGMRSLASPKNPNVEETVAPGEIQMQNFADGAPPPPPVSHSWKKIDRWAEKNYPELFDQLGEGCTQNDINELEHELDMSLPQDVRDSLSIHDGQERGGRPTGIIFGCMLLDCEEIVQEWRNWKIVNEEYLSGAGSRSYHSNKGLSNGASSSSQPPGGNRYWRQELLDRQESQPPRAIQKAYAHPGWISLARDWGGNNIAVDLAPGPTGKWGQVILFGRDYDCKYVVARSWAHFLAVVADDLSTDKVFVDDETGELKLKEFKTETVEPSYMEILRWRADQKYGRRGPRRRPQPAGLNTSVVAQNGRHSPYGSPVLGTEDRGRSPQRFSKGPSGSPRLTIGSPLARVQEEIAQPQAIRPAGDVVRDFAQVAESSSEGKRREKPMPIDPKAINTDVKPEKLVDAPTPASLKSAEPKEFPASRLSKVSTESETKDQPASSTKAETEVKGLGVDGIEDEMKTVAI